LGKNNNNVGDTEGEEDNEGTSEVKVCTTPKGQGEGTYPTESIGEKNNNVSNNEGEEDNEGTSKVKVCTTPKGQGEGAYPTKIIGKNNKNIGKKEGEEGDECTSKGKVYTTPKGQGEGTYQTKDEIEDCFTENKQCTTCNCKGIHSTKEDIADSVEEHPGVIPSNQHYAKHCSNCK
jgi:hypothetical protein